MRIDVTANSLIAAGLGSTGLAAPRNVSLRAIRRDRADGEAGASVDRLESSTKGDTVELSDAGLRAAAEARSGLGAGAASNLSSPNSPGGGSSVNGQPDPDDRATLSPDSSGESAKPSAGLDDDLTAEEREQVEKLEQRDREVRRHESAHMAAAGGQAKGGATFEYETGPDGKRYAVGGEVQIDTSEVRGNPRATIAKMQQVRRAANAPAEPSSQDRQVAAQARASEQRARAELANERAKAADGVNGGGAGGLAQSAPTGASSEVPNGGMDKPQRAESDLVSQGAVGEGVGLDESRRAGRTAFNLIAAISTTFRAGALGRQIDFVV